MAINFPNSPTTNQQYSYGTQTWFWNGSQWNLIPASAVATITNATNILGGTTGSVPYQSSANVTAFLGIGSSSQVLSISGGVPVWANAAVAIPAWDEGVSLTSSVTGLNFVGTGVTATTSGGNVTVTCNKTTLSNVAYGATPTVDWTGVDVARILLTGTCTPTFTGAVDGQKCILEVWQDGTGSRSMVLTSANVRYGTDITSITFTTTASKKDRVGFIYDAAANKYDVVAVVKGF